MMFGPNWWKCILPKRENSSIFEAKNQITCVIIWWVSKVVCKNPKVKRWLLISMTPKIMNHCIFLPIARKIWNALSATFYDGNDDELQVFVLNQEAFVTTQHGKSLSKYYGEPTAVFWKLDHCEKVVMKDHTDIVAYQNSTKCLRVHISYWIRWGLWEVNEEILGEEQVLDLQGCFIFLFDER
jgi:hypothetical protein